MGRCGGDAGTAAARPDPAASDALVLEYLRLVPAVARHLRLDRWPQVAAVDRDDYLAAGAEALVRAARTWQPDAGSPFVPYAWAAIGWAMRAEQSRMRWRRQGRPRPGRTLLSLSATWDHYPDDPDATVADILPDPTTPDPAAAELRAVVREALARLRPAAREVVWWCWLHDRPQDEVARRLGITQPAVSQRLRLARRELTRVLAAAVAA